MVDVIFMKEPLYYLHGSDEAHLSDKMLINNVFRKKQADNFKQLNSNVIVFGYITGKLRLHFSRDSTLRI